MKSYGEVSRQLVDALDLEHRPIAISVSDAVPAGVPAHEGAVPAGCSFWQKASRGPFATVPTDHENCVVGMHTHGLALETEAQKIDLKVSLDVFNELGYVRTEDIAQIPTLEPGRGVVVYAPLAQTPLEPDVVLVFASSRQGLLVTEAVQQLEGNMPPALGRPACAIVPQAVGSKRAALSLGCCGARAYLDVFGDALALWALPGPRVGEYADRIEVLAKANQVLTRFHEIRRADVEAGGQPSVSDSLSRLQASS